MLVLTACGGGGNNPGKVGTGEDALIVDLAGEGSVGFAEGSLLVGTSVYMEKIDIPPLPEDLVAVGAAYKIELDEQPTCLSITYFESGTTKNEIPFVNGARHGESKIYKQALY